MARSKEKENGGRSRFVRAVHVESDFERGESLDGYVLTATGRGILRRIAPAYGEPLGPRAWTLTGPYGTGKSAFAVFAANLLSRSVGVGPKKAREILEEADPDLAKSLVSKNGRRGRHGLMPVTVTGSREPIDQAILRGLDRSLTHIANGHGKSVTRDVKRCLSSANTGSTVGARNLTELLSATIDRVCTTNSRLDGLFLVVDELGKLLEYANSQPANSDIAILQSLAEFAERSPKPCLLLTILHQDFGAYANRLAPEEKAEWDKVRGRFEDIAFEEPAEEMLRLVGRALACSRRAGTSPRQSVSPPRAGKALCETAWKLGLAPGNMSKTEFVRLLTGCWPLHPLVTVMLGSVFRRLAQNERSAFSFLYSAEPFGFQEFLDEPGNRSNGLYGVDRLYNYLNHSVRDGLYASPQAKRWAETETILERRPDASPEDVFFVKTIGLINAIGQGGRIRASRELLNFASQQIFPRSDTNRRLRALTSQKIVVARKYNGTYALWEGSDVDLEAQLRVAHDRLDPTVTTADLAARYFSPRPIVARRHSYRTGALRYFPIHFLTAEDLGKRLASVKGPAILVILVDTAAQQKQAFDIAKGQRTKRRGDLVLDVPTGSQQFARGVRELACLEWVRDHVPELDGDRTARRELAVQIDGVRLRLQDTLDGILHADEGGPPQCVWYRKGRQIRFRSRRHFQDQLSAICDEVFSQSPCLRNELVNRRELSSAAAAARRNLIDRMITHSGEEDLGIEKAPPELSMYLSLLKEPGIHREGNEGWHFTQPRRNVDDGLQATWKAIIHFFRDTEKGSRPVSDLFDQLSKPPFGLLDGPLPVLLCAALLAHDNEVALYKEGSFVPVLNVPDFELLMKAPERYSVQKWRVTGVRASVFEQLARLVGRDVPGPKIGKPQILQIVRPLLKFVRGLNDYVQRTTHLSKTAIAIRGTLSEAREPDTLLFTDLPKSCGITPFRSRQRANATDVNKFVQRLRRGLAELQQCYPKLLDELLARVYKLSSKKQAQVVISRRFTHNDLV